MSAQATLVALLLTGIITVAVTAPPGQKPVITTAHNTSVLSLAKDSINTTLATPVDRVKLLQQICDGKPSLGKDCLAYNQLMRDMIVHNFKSNDTDLIFHQELSRTVTPQEDLCSNLTETVRSLPSQLMHEELKHFQLAKNCVKSCYTKQGEDDDLLKDSCRILYVGYRALAQSLQKPTSKATAPEQQPEKPTLTKQDTGSAKDENKPSNATIATKNKEPIGRIIPNESSNLQNAEKRPTQVATSPKKPEEVEKETSKQEKIAVPPQAADIPAQDVLEKNGNEDDMNQDGVDDANNSEDEQKELDNNTHDMKNQYDSNESAGRSSETVNDIPNTEDAKSAGNPVAKETLLDKSNLRGEEVLEPVDNSRTSDIMQGSDPFYNQNDSNFFSYFLFAMFSCAILYVAYHNKSKLMALVVEGRRTSSGRGGFSKGRKHTAAYRKLDSNLEEAITSGSASGGHSSSQIIY